VVSDKELEDVGAIRSTNCWLAPRRDPFPFAVLDRVLPRLAHQSLVPEVVDLIPSTSWSASLANMLLPAAWQVVRQRALESSGGCEECGAWRNIEAHERWSYDEAAGIQKLLGIRAMCALCHETQHLGLATVRGRFDFAFSRLCVINRIQKIEQEAYRRSIVEKYEARSRREWSLDISTIFSMVDALPLKSKFLYGGDEWVFFQPNGLHQERRTRVLGADFGSDGKRLFLVPIGTGPSA